METDLQQREVFHLAFLRELARSVSAEHFVLKGGSNLRFFFGSIRYSEDMDLDAGAVPVHALADRVMSILQSPALGAVLRPFGIERIVAPDLERAKQTETVQRFKVHLLTTAGEDLFTKVEFSRRGLDRPFKAEAVSSGVLAGYRLPPLVVPHYLAAAAARQKLAALLSRARPQARDVFDLWVLSTRVRLADVAATLSPPDATSARERILSIDYHEYRDAVVTYLGPDDQPSHDSRELWDEIRLRVAEQLEGAGEHQG